MFQYLCKFLFIIVLLISAHNIYAQETIDSTKDEFFLAGKKGLLGKLGKSVSTGAEIDNEPIKNNTSFTKYAGFPITKIYIQQLSFGASVNDTNWMKKNFVTRFADRLHIQTKKRIIRNNLFFKEGDAVFPYLLADNERHLREQLFLQDARIVLQPTKDGQSVEAFIITKDVFSLGGSIDMSSSESGKLNIQEENFLGIGDKLEASLLYDQSRLQKTGFGAAYTRRNIRGTFSDFTIGFQNYKPTFNSGRNEETILYATLNKPLVTPYFPFSYSIGFEQHQTKNQYITDSTYYQFFNYQYYVVDAWAAYNLDARGIINRNNPTTRLRAFLAARIFKQEFEEIPKEFINKNNYQYNSISGILTSFTLAKQVFYKTRFVYGFSRNEDIPEGFSAAIIGGYTNKQQRKRNYFGIDFQRSYFSKKKDYFSYSFKFGSFMHNKSIEDISYLLSVDYFSTLKRLSKRWTQRTFISASFTRLDNITLYDPLFISSNYGLPEFSNTPVAAEMRSTIKAEVVFFNPWSLYGFKFAPLIFGGTSFLTPFNSSFTKTDGYTSIGLGVRSRNENLIFGTMELKGYFFPRTNADMNSFRIDFITNLRYKFSSQFVKRPDFVVNN
jgi:hypothetical protein